MELHSLKPMILTDEQAAIAASMAKPGLVLMGRITRESFNGDNHATSGRMALEIGAVPEAALDGMRQAIRDAREGAKPRARGRRGKRTQPKPLPNAP